MRLLLDVVDDRDLHWMELARSFKIGSIALLWSIHVCINNSYFLIIYSYSCSDQWRGINLVGQKTISKGEQRQ